MIDDAYALDLYMMAVSVVEAEGTIITIGLTLKPDVPKTFEGMVLRPEVRWDHSTNTTPYDNGTSHDQWTFGLDVVIPAAFTH